MLIVFDYDPKRNLGLIKSDFLGNIREAFSEFDAQASIKKRKTNFRHIPTRKYCITKGGKFHIGLTSEIIKYVKKLGMPYRIAFSDEFKKAFVCSYPFHDQPLAEIKKPDNYQIRPYQEEGVVKAIRIGNGIFLLKTAAGKSYIIAKLVATVNKYRGKTKTLIIVPTIQLVEQMYSDLISYGFSPSKISRWSGQYSINPSADIIIASTSILLSKTQDLSILSHIDLLLVDECLRKNTKITTLKGEIPIQDIKIGDYVLSYNKNQKVNEYKKVLEVHTNLTKSNSYNFFLKIELENGLIIETTPNHKIYTTNRGFIRADQLKSSDDIKIFG